MNGRKYSIRENNDYFGRLEGEVVIPLFGCEMHFSVKGNDDIYAVRCAEFFESLSGGNLKEQTALYTCLEALLQYVADMLEEHSGEFDLDEAVIDGDSTVDDLLKLITPVGLMFERSPFIPEEECPLAYSIKFSFTPVPDQVMEVALHGDVPVYAGEYLGVSAWNDKLLKKKYNYLR